MLLPGVLELLVPQHDEVRAEASTGGSWVDDVVDEATDGSGEGVGEGTDVIILGLRLVVLTAEDDLHGTLGTHDGNLDRGKDD